VGEVDQPPVARRLYNVVDEDVEVGRVVVDVGVLAVGDHAI
jgi:hypothetical protein